MIVHSFYSWVVTILLGQKLCKQLKLFENQDISMVAATKKTVPKRRTESKEKRRLQLIKATIRTIAKRGLSDTTMATVAGDANLSQGIIMHFQSKDRLLVETLRYVADDYRNAWTNALQKTGPDSAEKLATLIMVDFDKTVCDRNKIAVWFAFWGESKSRPTYRKICAERDKEYGDMLLDLCANIASQGPYPDVDPEAVAIGLSAMSEGLWLDLLVSPDSMNPEKARGICMAYLASVFPQHFSHH
jgi:TetR/AcrR family transcriptional repressor of bet genes